MSSPEETRAIKLLKEVDLSVKSELGQRVKWAVVEALREKDQGWLPIETAPYDQQIWMLRYNGNMFQDFIYDIGHEEYAKRTGVTHWRPLPTLPK